MSGLANALITAVSTLDLASPELGRTISKIRKMYLYIREKEEGVAYSPFFSVNFMKTSQYWDMNYAQVGE